MTTVETTLRLDTSEIRTVKMRQAIQWQGHILPLASLRELLHLPVSLYPLPKPPPRPIDFDALDLDLAGMASASGGNGNGHGSNGNGTALATAPAELVPYEGEHRLLHKMFMVVVRVGDRQMGLEVDQLLGEQEIVIKPLSRFLGEVRGIAGVTILGDGQVAIICDVPSLINRVVQEQLLA
jgi:chemotaxis protein histidine kinase CheA